MAQILAFPLQAISSPPCTGDNPLALPKDHINVSSKNQFSLWMIYKHKDISESKQYIQNILIVYIKASKLKIPTMSGYAPDYYKIMQKYLHNN